MRQRRRAARRAGVARLPDRGRGRRRSRAGRDWLQELARREARRRGWRRPTCRCGSPPSGCRNSRLCGRSATLEPAIAAPGDTPSETWSPEAALIEIVRGRLEGSGPVTRSALAAPLGLERGAIDAALAALRGGRLRDARPLHAGRRTADEWCERRLLARIHRYTVKRLRAEIEPVAARDFLRFLFAWQRVTRRDAHGRPGCARRGARAARRASRRRPAPGRARSCRRASPDYEPAWLDDQCLAGRVAWTRLRPRAAPPERGGAARVAGAHHADHAVGAPHMRALGMRCSAGDERDPEPHAAQAVARLHPRARRLVLRRDRSTAPACCARRSRRRWPNWSRSAS